VKLTIIKSNILHSLFDTAPSETTVADLRSHLRTFHRNLPECMTLNFLLKAGENHPIFHRRSVIYYFHMFYVSTIMLLSRRLITAHMRSNPTQRDKISEQSSKGIDEEYMAARINAGFLGLMLSEGSVVPTCWFCISTAYAACIMITYGSIKKMLLGHAASILPKDLCLINNCMQTLSFCAQENLMAACFQLSLSKYVDELKDYQRICLRHEKGTTSSSYSSQPSFSISTSLSSPSARPPSPSPPLLTLQLAAINLLRLIHHPLSDVADDQLSSQAGLAGCMEIALGTRLEWEWELKNHVGAA